MANLLSPHPKRGEIYWVDFDKENNIDSEQKKHRPALVISTDSINSVLTIVTVAAVTTSVRSSDDDAVLILEVGQPLDKKSAVLLFQVRTISRARLSNYAGKLNQEQLTILNEKLINVWGL